jgi:hypothetical protein
MHDASMTRKSAKKRTVRSRGIEKIQLELLMKQKERLAAGLSKLSATELRSLNQWLNGHRELLGPGPISNSPTP